MNGSDATGADHKDEPPDPAGQPGPAQRTPPSGTAATSPSAKTEEDPVVDPEAFVRLRAKPPGVVRLSRKAVVIASCATLALVGGVLLYALQPNRARPPKELYRTEGHLAAPGISTAPGDYSQIPKLGPPLPGDLGRPLLQARQDGRLAMDGQPGANAMAGRYPDPDNQTPYGPRQPTRTEFEQDQQLQEAGTARTSALFLRVAAARSTEQTPQEDAGMSNLKASAADRLVASSPLRQAAPVSPDTLQRPSSPFLLQAGSVISAALVTGIRSDLPGQAIAQVTRDVYDSITGQHLLIAQGARLIGSYSASIATGQTRVAVIWTRLILPDGRSIQLGNLSGADAAGFAGLQDRVDDHWPNVARATLISTLLAVSSHSGDDKDSELTRAIREASQDSISRTGEQIIARELGLKPTLTIRPGHRVSIILAQDLVLEP